MRFERTKIWSSSSEFFLLSWWNLDFKHFSPKEICLQGKEGKRFKDWNVQKVQLIKTSKNFLHCWRKSTNRQKFGMVVRSINWYSINCPDELLGIVSTLICCVYLIYDGASKFHRVITCIGIFAKCSSFDLPLTSTMLWSIARRSSSSALNLDCYKSLDGQSTFTLFYKMNCQPNQRTSCTPLT